MERHDGFVISTDKATLNVDVIHQFIAVESYWGKGRSRAEIEETIKNSILCFGLYRDAAAPENMIGYGRVIGDNVTFGYLADVFVLEEWRGRGLGKWLVATIMAHPDIAKLRRMTLFTRTPEFYADAFDVYDQTGVSKFMQARKPVTP